MALDRSQRVSRDEALPEGLELTPQDYFVLSRVEGSISVGDLISSSGLPAADAAGIVERLLEAGALREATGGAPTRSRSASSPSRSSRLRAQAGDRRRRALAAALRGGPPAGSGVEGSPAPVAPAFEPAPVTAEQAREDASDNSVRLDRIDRKRVPQSDPRMDPECAIKQDDQRWILALADGHETMSQFEVLGIAPTHDVKAIRRAYHETSRALHPDAYYGRELGSFREILSELFREAKRSYAELRREEVRAPWVDRRIEEESLARRHEQAVEASERQRREAEAAERREARTRARAERKRVDLQTKMHREATSHLQEAAQAEEAGNLARASNLYRLAMRADPGNEEIAAKWKETRTAARKRRGIEAFARASSYLDIGQSTEALPLLLEAADADPTAEHLAHAAFAVRNQDGNRARNLAISALDALHSEAAGGGKIRPAEASRLHVKIGYAFLAVGQTSSARDQATLAAALRPDDHDVRALLKACKAK